MKRTVSDCDLCGSKDIVAHNFFFFTESQRGPVGVEDDGENMDICLACLSKLGSIFLDEQNKSNNYEQNKELTKRMRTICH